MVKGTDRSGEIGSLHENGGGRRDSSLIELKLLFFICLARVRFFVVDTKSKNKKKDNF